jgi:hypothetical protein
MAKTKLSNFSSSYSNLLPKTIEHMTLAAALLIRPLIHTGLIFIPGTGLAAAHPWKEQRAFTLNLLRGLGFGKRSMESTIADEAKRFVSVVAKERGSPVCINALSHHVVLICTLLYTKHVTWYKS